MAYEQGMSIQHDAINHVVTIHFRGKRYEIEVPGVDRATATAKGEEYCRKLGWVG
ncbi:phosphoribosylformylglycinamidine synthase subunit PurS [Rhizobium leguminosarum]|nr:phosphoribosylformylglycinamidine synthase subunit PurS [Rhizobium leguminosarum]